MKNLPITFVHFFKKVKIWMATIYDKHKGSKLFKWRNRS